MSSSLRERALTSLIGCFYWSQADDVIAALVHLKELSLQFWPQPTKCRIFLFNPASTRRPALMPSSITRYTQSNAHME